MHMYDFYDCHYIASTFLSKWFDPPQNNVSSILHFNSNNPFNGYTIIEYLLIIILFDNLQNSNTEASKSWTKF